MSVLLGLLRQLAGLLSSAGRYTAAGVTFGALGTVAALFTPVPWQVGFLIGFCLPWGPLYFYYTRRGALRAYLEEVKRLHDAKLITKADYDAHKEQAMRWHAERVFGRASTAGAAGPPSAPQGPTPTPTPAASPPVAPAQVAATASPPAPNP
jgi:hypothetical protein